MKLYGFFPEYFHMHCKLLSSKRNVSESKAFCTVGWAREEGVLKIKMDENGLLKN